MKFSPACSGLLPRGTFPSFSNSSARYRLLGLGPLVLMLAATTAHAIFPPEITVLGSNPVNVIEGDVYVDAGATAFDPDIGDITGLIVTTNPVNTGVVGQYTVIYDVEDAEFLTDQETRTVNVIFNNPPVVTVLGSNPVNVPEGATYVDAGATASDVEDNNNTLLINTVNPVNTSIPGQYTVTYSVTDSLGKVGNASRTVNVIGNNPPVLTPIGPRGVIEGGVLAIPLSASDPDGDSVFFSATNLPSFCLLTDANNGTGSIDCSPAVGQEGAYGITVSVTDIAPAPKSDFEFFTLTVGANQAPTASNVSIAGNPSLGELLTGSYTYADAEGDVEGISTYRWLRDGIGIPGAAGTTYTVVTADVETALRFEVTPVAATGATQGTPVPSADFQISNSAPSITGQVVIEIPEDSSREILLTDLTVTDEDSVFPDDFTLSVLDSPDSNYTRSGANGNTIRPVLDFEGPLTVPVTVNDGFVDSAVFDLLVTVLPINDRPEITGLVVPLSTPEDTSLTIVVTDLLISDPDNVYPTDFTLTLQPGLNYTLAGDGSTITPVENFNGQLSVPARVSDLEPLFSPVFLIAVDVSAVNDLPTLESPIGSQNAVENSPFNLNVTDNFSDADGDTLNYTATWLPQQPPNIAFNGVTGVFSGTPRLEDTEPPGPVYTATVTARDPSNAFVTDSFDLTISALDRANLSLTVDMTPDTAMPGDDVRWTFTARNPLGPQAGASVELVGSFVGSGLTVTAEAGASCTIQSEVNLRTGFVCVLGTLPVGASRTTVLTTATSQASEVYAFATAAGAAAIPIDPNEDDNSALGAAGVAEAFSVGAVQNLGNSGIRSVAAGDVNGDGAADLVVGTAAGQPVQIYLNAAPRESCQCLRDFLTSPVSVPDTGSNEGVALADFDGNGSLDLVVANGGGQADMVYGNDGSGNFSPMATLGGSFAQDVAVGDFNNNGDMDLAVAAIGGNPVWFGNGNGGFSLGSTLGSASSVAVAVARFDANSRDDLVFANVGSSSRIWTKNSGGGFTSRDQLPIGDVSSVAAADLNGNGRPDLLFGRVPTDVGDIPSNPVLRNDGTGRFGNPVELLGISPTNDVHIGDVNSDGSPDLVFINASGVHQIWMANGGGYVLHREQIIDGGAVAGVLTDLGFTDNNDPGGPDLAMGGATSGGVGVFLNDGVGSLGRGDLVPPVITLNGSASVSVEAKTNYADSGATAEDNIDGTISASINVTNMVDTSVVGAYTVSYNVTDFAGNAAETVTRIVNVTPGGGGGGGSVSYWATVGLLGFLLVAMMRRSDWRTVRLRSIIRNKRVLK